MGVFDDFVCETRYCPDCGVAIFCRTGANDMTIFYTSEEMDTSLTCCPSCDLDLLSGDKDMLLDELPAESSSTRRTREKAGKGDLVASLHDANPDVFPTKASAERAFEAVGEELLTRLARGENIGWPGLGTFKLRRHKARNGRNPQTGEPLTIPARTVVTFTPAKGLKDKLNS